MARQTFTNIDRRAFFEAHHGKCAYCNKPVTYGEMELDHLVAVKLADDDASRAKALSDLHLPAEFDLHADANILVACGPCNLKKSDMQLPAPHVGLLHATALRIAPEVARLREKYRRIVSTDRLVLNLVNAFEAKSGSREELDALLWAYFGRSEFKLDFPVRFAGRLETSALSKADLEDLWDRPVELWGDGKTGLPLVHQDGREREVHTTREYLDASREGFFPDANPAIKASSLFDYALGLFFALEHGRPAATSFISHPRIGLCDLRHLTKDLAPTFEPDDEQATAVVSLQDLKDAGALMVQEISSLSLAFTFGGIVTNLSEILRADLDGDGIEEVLVSSYSRAEAGTLGFGRSMVLGRKSGNELLRILDVGAGPVAGGEGK